MKFGFNNNDLLPILLLFFCISGNNGFDDVLGELDEVLPWLLVLLCASPEFIEDLLDDIEDWLPWLLLIYCCCFRKC